MNKKEYFSDRNGLSPQKTPITIISEAPQEFRKYLLELMLEFDGMRSIRNKICFVAKEAESPRNWKANKFMKSEILSVLDGCAWNKIYDIIEHFYSKLKEGQDEFAKQLNEYFIEKGYGWKLTNGLIERRGEEGFEISIAQGTEALADVGLPTSRNEISEALKDLSKRPEPDITGAMQHSMAALECLCRELTGKKDLTLGQVIKKNPQLLPSPLGGVVTQIYGYASNNGRHMVEGGEPNYEETEFIVHLSASICAYLVKKHFPKDD